MTKQEQLPNTRPEKKYTRRRFLRLSGGVLVGAAVGGCSKETGQKQADYKVDEPSLEEKISEEKPAPDAHSYEKNYPKGVNSADEVERSADEEALFVELKLAGLPVTHVQMVYENLPATCLEYIGMKLRSMPHSKTTLTETRDRIRYGDEFKISSKAIVYTAYTDQEGNEIKTIETWGKLLRASDSRVRWVCIHEEIINNTTGEKKEFDYVKLNQEALSLQENYLIT